MNLFPAIDIYQGKVVRLLKGDYEKMTVYQDDPLAVAENFQEKGAKFVHIVDLEGARSGGTPNEEIISRIAQKTDLFVQTGGGIRNLQTVENYLSAGVDRVILGTAAAQDETFLCEAVAKYGDRIAVGVDCKNGYVAVKGWTQISGYTTFSFCDRLADIGVSTLICTDIAKDGAMQGIHAEYYRELKKRYSMNIIASGGVSCTEDIRTLKNFGLYGAILGKAYYIGAITLEEALEAAK